MNGKTTVEMQECYEIDPKECEKHSDCCDMDCATCKAREASFKQGMVESTRFEDRDCLFCEDGRIDDWRTYLKTWRYACQFEKNKWMNTVPWTDVLQNCREIRDGWIGGFSGQKHYHADCPMCMY